MEVRSPLALQGVPRDSSCIAAGMNMASIELRRESQCSSPFQTSITGSLHSWNKRVRPRLVLRNGTPLASRVVHGVTGHLSSCIWNLQLFPDDVNGESVPLRVGGWYLPDTGGKPGGLVTIQKPRISTSTPDQALFPCTNSNVSLESTHNTNGVLVPWLLIRKDPQVPNSTQLEA